MAEVLLISKPVAPPWNDSSKNLVYCLARELRAHRPTVLTTRHADIGLPHARVDRIYTDSRGVFAPSLAQNARVLRRLLTGRRAALWHFFFAPNPRSSWTGKLAAVARRTPTVQTVCSAPKRARRASALVFADKTVVVSRLTEDRFLAEGVPRDKLVRIAPAVDPIAARTGEQVRAARGYFGIPSDAALVVYAGDLELGNGARLALEATALMKRSTDTHLAIACRVKTPAAAEAERLLRGQAADLGIAARVAFIGETRRIHDLLAAADVVAMPSEDLFAKMDLPLVLIEAMSLGRVVVVSHGSAAAELADGEAALAVEPAAEAVALAISRVFDDAAMRERVGANAARAVRERFSPTTMARSYERVYEELLR